LGSGSVLAFHLRDAVHLQDMSLLSLLDQAWRLTPFTPPFAFSAFFSPEDTLLCVCAADAARLLLTDSRTTMCEGGAGIRIVELTSGSGLVGLYLLGRDCHATLLGLDIDTEAKRVAERNDLLHGLPDRARFAQSDLWSRSTQRFLEVENPQMIVCNPPYVPEPPGTKMQIEAGAGPNGTAHILRAIELAELVQPDTLALSWCSLSDPAGVVEAAETSGYKLHTLFVTAIADGEYSGSVHSYLRDLDDCYINEQSETLCLIAPDGSARFAYLLLAGAFRRRGRDRQANTASAAVRKICEDFSRSGVLTLGSGPLPIDRCALPDCPADAPFSLHYSVLSRWDELRLRTMLHGEVARRVAAPA
jgi:hypothetical protein